MGTTVSQAPLSDEALERFANKWVAVRGGEVVASADGYDELRATGKAAPTDAIYHVPAAGSLFY